MQIFLYMDAYQKQNDICFGHATGLYMYEFYGYYKKYEQWDYIKSRKQAYLQQIKHLGLNYPSCITTTITVFRKGNCSHKQVFTSFCL